MGGDLECIFYIIFGVETKCYLVLIIRGIIFCDIEGSHVLLALFVGTFYHYLHLSIRVIVIHVHIRSIILAELLSENTPHWVT